MDYLVAVVVALECLAAEVAAGYCSAMAALAVVAEVELRLSSEAVVEAVECYWVGQSCSSVHRRYRCTVASDRSLSQHRPKAVQILSAPFGSISRRYLRQHCFQHFGELLPRLFEMLDTALHQIDLDFILSRG